MNKSVQNMVNLSFLHYERGKDPMPPRYTRVYIDILFLCTTLVRRYRQEKLTSASHYNKEINGDEQRNDVSGIIKEYTILPEMFQKFENTIVNEYEVRGNERHL